MLIQIKRKRTVQNSKDLFFRWGITALALKALGGLFSLLFSAFHFLLPLLKGGV